MLTAAGCGYLPPRTARPRPVMNDDLFTLLGGPAEKAGEKAEPAPKPEPPPPPPPPPPVVRKHLMLKGETLWQLAVRYYGDGQQWVKIQEANPGVKPTAIRVGTEITVP